MLVVGFGVVLAGMNTSFYYALHHLPLGPAVTFEFLGPLTVALLGSRRLLDLAWVVLAAAGVVALSRGGIHALPLAGVSPSRCWRVRSGAVTSCSRARSAGRSPVAEGSRRRWSWPRSRCSRSGSPTVGHGCSTPGRSRWVPWCALLSSAIPYSLEVEALRRIRASVFAVLMSLEPAIAALAGFLILGQNLSARQMLGILLVVVASAGAMRRAAVTPIDP